eukprot:TRINITY_DN100983_c0_g1_i1.p1 TRINITY_DN100983_c0_g1~~TRINITY_DN100983_c0_g1_i1.p1  ORF type:complete len:410 (+),score=82.59 TRINITY_DN100983_c0_g1_i1:171-1400(+)
MQAGRGAAGASRRKPKNVKALVLAGLRNPETKWETVQKNLQQLRQRDYLDGPKEYTIAITALARVQDWWQASEMLEEMQRERLAVADIVARNAVANALAGAGEWSGALDVFRTAQHAGLRANVVTYGTALSACESATGWQASMAKLGCLGSSGFDFHEVTINAAASICAKNHKWEWSEHLLVSMEQLQLTPDIFTYSAVTTGYQKEHRWELAVLLLWQMIERQVAPDAVCLSAIIGACASGMKWQLCLHVLYQMGLWSLQCNVISVTSAMSACEKCEEWLQAVTLLHGAKTKGVGVSTISHMSVVGACASGAAWSQAICTATELAGWMFDVPEPFDAALNACLGVHAWGPALQVVSTMREAAVEPSLRTHQACLAAYEGSRFYERMPQRLDAICADAPAVMKQAMSAAG